LRTVDVVEQLVSGTVQELGYELCDVEFLKEQGNWVLTLYIHSPEGITLDDCEKVSRAVDPILDEADPIEQSYYLSVSSLGIDRPLKKQRDFERNLGNVVEVKLYAPRNKKKEFMGELVSFDEEGFLINTKDAQERFTYKETAQVRPHIEF